MLPEGSRDLGSNSAYVKTPWWGALRVWHPTATWHAPAQDKIASRLKVGTVWLRSGPSCAAPAASGPEKLWDAAWRATGRLS